MNSVSEENMRNRTRLMTLDKELNKREKLLQTMLKPLKRRRVEVSTP